MGRGVYDGALVCRLLGHQLEVKDDKPIPPVMFFPDQPGSVFAF